MGAGWGGVRGNAWGSSPYYGSEFGCFQFNISGMICQVERVKFSGFPATPPCPSVRKLAESVNSRRVIEDSEPFIYRPLMPFVRAATSGKITGDGWGGV